MANSSASGGIIKDISPNVALVNKTSPTITWTTIFNTRVNPKSSSSKFLIMFKITTALTTQSATAAGVALNRNGTLVQSPTSPSARTPATCGTFTSVSYVFIDSPATTSTINYTVEIRGNSSGSISYLEDSNNQLIILEI